MVELFFNSIRKFLGVNKIFEDVNFQIYSGERVGIVGVNGCGKSTILKLIAGIIEMTRDDSGNIFITRGAKSAYLDQLPDYDEKIKARDVLHEAFEDLYIKEKELKKVEKAMNTLSGDGLERALKDYSRLRIEYEAEGGYQQEEKLSKICEGLNLTEDFLDRKFNVLSGGEKTTVILGKILLQNPDILLLDEPTNHLDMRSVEWLESYLKTYKGIVIVVSHDRYFLDNVVTKIIEIEDGFSETYKGNYSSYVKEKEANLLIEFENYKEQQKKITAMEKTIKDLRDWAARSDNVKFYRRAASMQKSLDRMEKIEKPKEKKAIKLSFNEAERSGNEVFVVRELNKSFNDKLIFKGANLNVRYGTRTALIGDNGSGKTTLIKLLLGDDTAESGVLKVGESVKLAYLPQNIEFNDENATVLEAFRENFSILEGKAREYLSKFMFYGADVFKKVCQLSGGERVRLKLSILLNNDINLLILDEPTNHLDIPSIENLEEALENFKGTIFFVSHDRYFINDISDHIIAIENKGFKAYEGNYDDYKVEKSKAEVAMVKEKKQQKEKIKKPVIVELKKSLQKEVEKLEMKISEFEKCLATLSKEMEHAEADYERLNELYSKKVELQKRLDETIALWEEKSSELEQCCD